MSDLIRFFFVLSLGFSVSILLYFIMCFPSFSLDSCQRSFRIIAFIQFITVLIAFIYSHMFYHIINFIDYLTTCL